MLCCVLQETALLKHCNIQFAEGWGTTTAKHTLSSQTDENLMKNIFHKAPAIPYPLYADVRKTRGWNIFLWQQRTAKFCFPLLMLGLDPTPTDLSYVLTDDWNRNKFCLLNKTFPSMWYSLRTELHKIIWDLCKQKIWLKSVNFWAVFLSLFFFW